MKWIQQWYVAHCDGDWEHEYGIAIETLDNPGRSVKISVDNTDLKDKPLENIVIWKETKLIIFLKDLF
ncbi:Imm53 family immunity protein [Cytobacillus pseudoceanisediminis]|uniref:Imm53 family immunity protein n=1 Tax=Cytobacillus pseudoceanisediminis TaxID=3051614 RepID=UPI00365127EB